MMKPAAQRRRGALGWVIILLLAALALFTLIAVFSYLAGYVALSVRTIANLELKHCVQRGTVSIFWDPYWVSHRYYLFFSLLFNSFGHNAHVIVTSRGGSDDPLLDPMNNPNIRVGGFV